MIGGNGALDDAPGNALGDWEGKAVATLDRPIVLIGLMGAGKSNIGRRLAKRLEMPFTDVDEEIVRAAGRSIEEIFEEFGESHFREGERRIIARLLSQDHQVLATGGGAFMDPGTRQRIRERGISIWLRADLDVLVRRTSGRAGRPLLKGRDARIVLARLMAERYPVYADADIIIDTGDASPEDTTDRVVAALAAWPSSPLEEMTG